MRIEFWVEAKPTWEGEGGRKNITRFPAHLISKHGVASLSRPN